MNAVTIDPGLDMLLNNWIVFLEDRLGFTFPVVQGIRTSVVYGDVMDEYIGFLSECMFEALDKGSAS